MVADHTQTAGLRDITRANLRSSQDDLSLDEWRRRGAALAAMERDIQWLIGDWWVFGQARYGERAKAAAKGVFGLAFQTLVNAGVVARRFEPNRRRLAL